MSATEGQGADLQVAVLGTGIMGSAMVRNLILRGATHDRMGPVAGGGGGALDRRRTAGSVARGGGPRCALGDYNAAQR